MKNVNYKSIATLLSTAIIIIVSFQTANAYCHENDFKALKAFYESTNGDDWFNNAGWEVLRNNDEKPANCDLRNLEGITMWAGRVIRIQFGKNNITGKLPRSIYFLDKLEILSIEGNPLSGVIPSTIGYCKNLKSIDLKDNNLENRIPSSIGFLENLTHLCLGNNQLAGVIPASIGNCTELMRLEIPGNQISGEIPKEIGKLNKMVTFDACWNNLSGCIPAELGACESLRYCRLNDNDLENAIPAAVGNISNLRQFYVNNNNLEGCYPVNLRKICLTLDRYSNTNYSISDGNNFNESWEDFDQYFMGMCEDGNKIANAKNESLTIYPNPSQGIFNVSVLKDNLRMDTSTELTIYNTMGSIVYSENLNEHSLTNFNINVSNLAKGSYFITLNNEGAMSSKKLMIK